MCYNSPKGVVIFGNLNNLLSRLVQEPSSYVVPGLRQVQVACEGRCLDGVAGM